LQKTPSHDGPAKEAGGMSSNQSTTFRATSAAEVATLLDAFRLHPPTEAELKEIEANSSLSGPHQSPPGPFDLRLAVKVLTDIAQVQAGALPAVAAPALTFDDFQEAGRFIERLTGESHETARCWFQTFDDGPEKNPALAKVMHGTLAEVWPRIQWLQQRGAGVFVTVNPSNGGRKKEDVTGIRCVFRDVDTGTAPDLPLAEHMRVETPGGFHSYLLVNAGAEVLGEWDAVMQRVDAEYGADKKAVDRGRVLRLPGTWHLKDPANPQKIRIANMSEREPYTWAEIRAAIPPLYKTPQSAKSGTAQHAGRAVAREDSSELIRQMISGENFHDSCLRLSARYITGGMPEAEVVETIKGLMLQADDGSDRFKSRFAEIPRIVKGGQKFAPGSTHATLLTTLLGARGVGVAGTALVDKVLGEMAGNKSLRPAEVEDILARLKDETKIGIKALRADLQSRNEGATGEGSTHADYAMQLLASLDETGEHPPVAVDGMIYSVGPDSIWRGRQAEDYSVEVGERFSGRKGCTRRGDYVAVAVHAHDIAKRGNEGFFDDAPMGLVDPAGMFHTIDARGELHAEPLRSDHRQRFAVDACPADVATPMLDQFLQQTFESTVPGEQQAQIGLLQEVVGGAMLGLMARHEKAALLLGAGRSGKGTLLKLLDGLVPKPFRSACTPFNWDREYYLADLAGKRLNIVGELPEDQPIPAAAFKTVTGRDVVQGRFPSGRVFTFRNEAAHIFNSNHFVNTRDHSTAFYARWLVIGFENSRLGMGEGAIDEGLAKRILAEELPGLMLWALRGAARLHKRGHFTTTATHERLMAQWKRKVDSVMEFLHDEDAVMLRQGIEVCDRGDLYKTYLGWAPGVGRKAIGKQKFFEALESPAVAGLGITVKPRNSKGEYRVRGVTLAPNAARGAHADDWK
jgi:putative DNA primase/helicase